MNPASTPQNLLLNKILSAANDVVVIVDQEGIIRYKSPNVTHQFGWDVDSLIGTPAIEHIHPDDRDTANAFIAGVLKKNRSKKPIQMRYQCQNKEYKWIEFEAINLIDDPDVRGILGFYRDITKIKEAEQQTTASHELLTNLARLVPGVIYQYRLDPDGHSAFPYSSPGMYQIYEVTPEEVRSDASPVFSRLHPEDTEEVSNRIVASARDLTHFQVEFRVILPKQGLRWRWSQAVPERTAEGGTLWHGIILDITDRKTTELEKNALQLQLSQSQKLESVGRLAGGVAHDFNNMLGVIAGYTEMLLDDHEMNDNCRKGLTEIQKASNRSTALTRQLLAFARKQTVAPKQLNLNETISGMLSIISRLIGENITLQWNPGENLSEINMDPTQVDQIVANLCINARDAISGVGQVTIETYNCVLENDFFEVTETLAPGPYVALSVRDDGVGIDDSVMQNLFEPFFTTKPQGQGTGLGLATIYGITKQNGGCIRVESRVGEGATFTIYFKRHEPLRDDKSSLAQCATVYVEEATILVVEDESVLLMVVVDMLEKGGYTVLSCDSPNKAIEIAKSFQGNIDMLLTDVIMPDKNGRQLAEEIAAIRPNIRSLYMSGYTSDVIAPHGILGNEINFIAKPFSRQQLLDKVREVLGVRLRLAR